MSRPKINHYNPQSVVRSFSIEGKGKRVWVFDKKTGSTHQESISTAGGEKYFNHVVIDGKGIDFEDVFDEVDGVLPRLLGQIMERGQVASLNAEGRDALALLATIQFLRTKIVRDTARSMPSQLRKSLEDAGLGECASAIPTATDNDGRKVGLALLRDARKMASHLRQKELTLYRALKGSSFWTSDGPIVMANHFPGGNLGLGARGVEVFWPISPAFLVSFRCPSIRKKASEDSPEVAAFLASEPVLLCRPKDVEWMNSLQVLRSTRFIYADKGEFGLARRLLAERDEQDPPVLFSVGAMGTMPQRSGMPQGISLLASGRDTEHICPVQSWTRKDGAVHVLVPAEAERTVQNLLKDGPFHSAEIHDADGPGSGMRDVVIKRVSEDPIELLIEHADPGLRGLMRQLDGRR